MEANPAKKLVPLERARNDRREAWQLGSASLHRQSQWPTGKDEKLALTRHLVYI
jgi:hypothetical protein